MYVLGGLREIVTMQACGARRYSETYLLALTPNGDYIPWTLWHVMMELHREKGSCMLRSEHIGIVRLKIQLSIALCGLSRPWGLHGVVFNRS